LSDHLPNHAAPGWYRFKLGSLDVTVLSDGPLPIRPPERGFIDVPNASVSELLQENYLPTDHLPLAQNVVVVDTGRKRILIDAGVGTSAVLQSRKYGPDAGRLIPNMRASGIDPSSIDIVALTHPHHDHCWGLVDESGNANFPNAELAISEDDFRFWTDESKLSGTSPNPAWVEGARHSLLPYADRIIPLRDRQEIATGLTALASPGHTIGHHLFAISSEGRTMIHMGDSIHHQLLLLKHPEWRVAWDTDADLGVQSRLRLLDMISTDRLIALGYHCAWPGHGHIAKERVGYSWIPVPMYDTLNPSFLPAAK